MSRTSCEPHLCRRWMQPLGLPQVSCGWAPYSASVRALGMKGRIECESGFAWCLSLLLGSGLVMAGSPTEARTRHDQTVTHHQSVKQHARINTYRVTRSAYGRKKLGSDANGSVSRVSPVHTAMRNCTRDEGGPFEVGNQVLISSHRKLLSSKAMVVSVAETAGQDPVRQG